MSISIHRNSPSQASVIDFIARENKKFKPPVETLDAASPPSTVVKLHQAKDKNLTYENIKQRSISAWGNMPLDAISMQLSQNLAANTAPDRLNGLGDAVLNYFESDKDNFNQSLINFSTPEKIKGNPDTNATFTKLVQERLDGAPTDQVTLSLKTKSGINIDLQIKSLFNTVIRYDDKHAVTANGLAIDIKASAELSQEEREALAKLASGLENAIQGLNLEKPQTDIAELLQFDSNIFDSLDLNVNFKDPANIPFIFEFHTDKNKRNLNIELHKNLQTVGGKFEINIDLKNPELWSDEAQKKKAIDNYLKQVDQAANRGNNKKEDVIDIFKQSFASVHQFYPKAQFAEAKTDKKLADTVITPTKLIEKPADATISPTKLIDKPADVAITPEKSIEKPTATVIAPIKLIERLADQDLATLSGMADFKVNLSTEGKSNPIRHQEVVDHFNYQISQKTNITGKESRMISQLQKADLNTSYHTQLNSDKPVILADKKELQSYDLYQVKDHAESLVTLEYDKNRIIKANIEKSADQSTLFERFLRGKQTKEKISTQQQTANYDLLQQLEPLVKDQDSTSSIYRQQKLLLLNKNIALETNPDQLKQERDLEPN